MKDIIDNEEPETGLVKLILLISKTENISYIQAHQEIMKMSSSYIEQERKFYFDIIGNCEKLKKFDKKMYESLFKLYCSEHKLFLD
jgi:hypothetical protein